MTRVRGYYRFPTISSESIVFVSEDDLWAVSTSGGVARRLTAGQGECSYPVLSPDGRQIAYVAREEGEPEVYVMPAEGGLSQRITFMGSFVCRVTGWSSDGLRIAFISDGKSWRFKHAELFEIDALGGMPRPLNLGHAVSMASQRTGPVVIGRNSSDPALWKRYRGGMAGELWIDPKGNGTFRRLINLPGNLASPMWINGRVYFLSDHDGIGNIYSCKPDGSDLRKHTHHDQYYVRHPSTDGDRIVYTSGADLYLFDPASDKSLVVDVSIPAAPRQSVRRFIPASRHLEHFAVHPVGHSIGLICRGQPFTMPFWEEAVIQHGAGSKGRYRLLDWLADGEHFVVVSDVSGYERIEVHAADQSQAPYFACKSDIGRVVSLAVSPLANKIAVANHKHQLLLVDIDTKKAKVIDHSPADRIADMSWSPDGRFIAYSYAPCPGLIIIRVYDTQKNKHHDLTRPVRFDFSPSWDPEGNYLYFLSSREFNPVYDSMQFDLSFPFGVRPYLVTLRQDVPSPFVPNKRALNDTNWQQPLMDAPQAGDDKASSAGSKRKNSAEARVKSKDGSASKKNRIDGREKGTADAAPTGVRAKAKPVEIDFEGIQDRVLAFPVEEGRFWKIVGLPGRVVFTQAPVKGIKRGVKWSDESQELANLMAYDFKEQRVGLLQDGVFHFAVARDNRTLVYSVRKRLRAIDALSAVLDTPPRPAEEAARKTGWLDIERVNVMIEPFAEWEQMFNESWRLQREHFWDEAMSKVDWDLVHRRYAALVPRIHARTELSDLIWEMQGELGTSHAYEIGGDHRYPPSYYRGFLGADLSYDSEAKGYRIKKILRGDSWDPEADSPLASPGLGIKEGDVILAIGGRQATRSCSVDELLLNCSGKDVMLTIATSGKKKRNLAVKTLKEEKTLRYRHWVESNRKYVHDQTDGKVGYIHIPDMGAAGFAEFHRSYLSEINREALVVDVRYNAGGHVSPLLLEKLARKRVGYDVSRWGEPLPYPPESVAGPMVAITNQFAGSDGDIFSHCFKLYGLGPLVGKRTWGGVIGIWPRHFLVDGTITTQPEFSFWFNDAGFGVENYGTDPDYDVDFAPQDYRAGRDPQMDKALELIKVTMKEKPFKLPKFDGRPSRALPAAKTTSKKASVMPRPRS